MGIWRRLDIHHDSLFSLPSHPVAKSRKSKNVAIPIHPSMDTQRSLEPSILQHATNMVWPNPYCVAHYFSRLNPFKISFHPILEQPLARPLFYLAPHRHLPKRLYLL